MTDWSLVDGIIAALKKRLPEGTPGIGYPRLLVYVGDDDFRVEFPDVDRSCRAEGPGSLERLLDRLLDSFRTLYVAEVVTVGREQGLVGVEEFGIRMNVRQRRMAEDPTP